MLPGHKKGVDYHRCYSFLWWMGPLFFVGFTKAKWPCEEKNLPIFWKSWYKIHLKRASLSIHLFLDDDEGRQILKSRGQIDQSRQFFLSFFPLPQKIGKPQAALEIEWDKPWEKSRTLYFCGYCHGGEARAQIFSASGSLLHAVVQRNSIYPTPSKLYETPKVQLQSWQFKYK